MYGTRRAPVRVWPWYAPAMERDLEMTRGTFRVRIGDKSPIRTLDRLAVGPDGRLVHKARAEEPIIGVAIEDAGTGADSVLAFLGTIDDLR
jgi:hypothetical protein